MSHHAAFIGFGEAGRAFAWSGARAFDRKTDEPASRGEMLAAYALASVDGAESAAAALAGAQTILCLVTADQALAAARDYARFLQPGALWLDMNSVAPETKRAAAQAIEAADGRYVDVAVLAPVHPARRAVPLLASGPHADAALALLGGFGFTDARRIEGDIGAASAVKMIRSVMVKGIEALTAECVIAAEAAGVRNEVLASLDASEKARGWADRADYNLERMLAHGLRRAAEMEEVVKTLDALGTGSAMSRGTVERQRALGCLGIAAPKGLAAKLAVLLSPKQEKAA
ncbi:NAD(P)-dependent oxidoreductase [Rhizorhabdus dicambivorans]|uniref:NAD(P)-dependent oxidoreductase n=1 Tax=Rhizorhabdus dicambivorans TaxID=1850238 RepID=A0A2A4FUX2_9SPHN|nr:NAD(P)-dependent oxidoreductase [Rhizorhabdus dicambivorans]ATE64148.1 NAD(P)-dependent oxidoreductase [Rhizorhabdus dicambivorans]PCE42581.1 NAD(P)-dependent oxidoreductase [Rhizorhabdus dicambivorans]